VEAQGQPGDMFIGISTSGNSKNVIRAVEAAKFKGIHTIAFCGAGGALPSLVDLAIQVPSESTPYIQECHISIGHIVCAVVEQEIFG
jgi:D-sedoheptulose 7-phosphate isomerase